MSEIVTIGKVKTPVIHYKDERVCTTQQLAQFYGADEVRIQQNYARNAERFEEGKHFHKVSGGALENLRLSFSELQISSKTRSLILWTERGAMRHAKMLESDTAWEMFELMEDSYFAVLKSVHHVHVGNERSTKFDRLPLYHFVVEMVIRHRLIFSKAYELVNLFAGSRHFQEMSKDQVAEVGEFCRRFSIGKDTRTDWQRITDNQTKLHGTPAQLDMVQKLLLS